MLELEVVNCINGYLDSKGIRYSNELRMGIGIPDISFNIGANSKLKPMNDYFQLLVLKFVVKKRAVSFTEIKNEFLLTIERVKLYVSTLEGMNLVKVKNQIVKAIRNILSSKLGTTISIEAKLKDWKGACLQAQRYLLFSDYAYVAMPEAYIKNVNVNIFKQSGIGLLATTTTKIKEILPARKSESCEIIQKYLVTSKIMERYYDMKKNT